MKEKVEVKYTTMQTIVNFVKTNLNCGIRECSFDWDEIAIKGLKNRRRIIKFCKRYGKIKRHRKGFSVRFTYV